MSQRVYMVFTFVLLGISAGALANRYVLPDLLDSSAESTAGEAGSAVASESGSLTASGAPTGSADRLDVPPLGEPAEGSAYGGLFGGRASTADIEWSDSSLVVGIPATVPMGSSLPTVRDMPWSLRDAGQAFRGRRVESAELVPSGNPVQTELARPGEGAAAALGRVLAFTVGLKVDPLARGDIPQVSRGQIETYLDNHLLSIQPSLYVRADGSYFLGPTVRAAFFDRSDSDRTTDPESMIATAVREFRAIGLYDDGSEQPGRTLVLEFRYDSGQTGRLGGGSARKEYELLLIHLMKTEPGEDPKLTAFATGDGRQTLHALDVSNPLRAGGTPAVTATIRFDDFTMMGLYPAKPVVTGVRHASVASVSAEQFRTIVNGLGSTEPVPMTEALDRLARGELVETEPAMAP